MERQIAYGVVYFCRTMDGRVLAMRKVYQVHAVFLGIDCTRLCAFITIVYDDLIIFTAWNQVLTICWKVNCIYFVGILAEYFRHTKTSHHLIGQFHFDFAVNGSGPWRLMMIVTYFDGFEWNTVWKWKIKQFKDWIERMVLFEMKWVSMDDWMLKCWKYYSNSTRDDFSTAFLLLYHHEIWQFSGVPLEAILFANT